MPAAPWPIWPSSLVKPNGPACPNAGDTGTQEFKCGSLQSETRSTSFIYIVIYIFIANCVIDMHTDIAFAMPLLSLLIILAIISLTYLLHVRSHFHIMFISFFF